MKEMYREKTKHIMHPLIHLLHPWFNLTPRLTDCVCRRAKHDGSSHQNASMYSFQKGTVMISYHR